MILQHDDPHRHMAPGIETVYYFLILAPIVVAFILFLGWKLMNYIENRRIEKRPEKPDPAAKSDRKES